MKLKVSDCARCGKTHEIEFKEFSQNPIESDGKILTHWGMCSNIDEPVLLRIEAGDMNENDIIISFTEEAVKKYLDNLIDFWREQRVEYKEKEVISGDDLVAHCYTDAYQSVRKNLFGELKDEE